MTDQVNDPVEPQVEPQAEPQVEPQAEPQSNGESDKLKNDLFKFKRMHREAQEKLAKLEADRKEAEEKSLAGQQKYKELYEKAAQERDEFKNSLSSLKTGLVDNEIKATVRQEALKQGLNPEFTDFLDVFDMSDVDYETTSSGKVIVNNAKDWVQGVKELKPSLFLKGNAPKVNNGGGGEPATKYYTPAEVLEIQSKDPKLYQELMTTKRNLIRR